MRLHTIVFGCQMSFADAEEMSRALAARGFVPAEGLDDADAVLVNTCTVRDHAEHRAVSQIGRLKQWKDARPGRLLIVAGCAAQRMGGRLRERFPHVDLVVGSASVADFPAIVERALEGRFSWTRRDEAPVAAAGFRPSSPVSARVTVMRGCARACAYCIVPSVRGPEVCRPLESVLSGVRKAVSTGAKEVVLLGQTVNGWKDGDLDFADLLRSAAGVEGVERVRFMSPHPALLDERTARAMAEVPRICPHLHLPVQSGSDRVLAAMKRGYTRAEYLRRVEAVRRLVPDLELTTDALTGFPGETEEDFRRTLSLLEEAGVCGAYCFKFSPREGTPAAAMEGAVPKAVVQERLARLLSTAERLARERLSAWRGRTVEVLLETPVQGRTPQFLAARLDRPGTPGDIVRAEVLSSTAATLRCRLLAGAERLVVEYPR